MLSNVDLNSVTPAKSFLLDLPDEIIVILLEYLSLPEIVKIMQCSKFLNEIAKKSNTLWGKWLGNQLIKQARGQAIYFSELFLSKIKTITSAIPCLAEIVQDRTVSLYDCLVIYEWVEKINCPVKLKNEKLKQWEHVVCKLGLTLNFDTQAIMLLTPQNAQALKQARYLSRILSSVVGLLLLRLNLIKACELCLLPKSNLEHLLFPFYYSLPLLKKRLISAKEIMNMQADYLEVFLEKQGYNFLCNKKISSQQLLCVEKKYAIYYLHKYFKGYYRYSANEPPLNEYPSLYM